MLKLPRIVLVDDHALFGEALAAKLEEELEVKCRACRTIEDGMEAVLNFDPELVILDYNMDGREGLGIYSQLSPVCPTTRWLVCTAVDSPTTLSRILGSGVDGVVLKRDSLEEMVKAARALLENNQYACAEIRSRIAKELVDDVRLNFTEAEVQLIKHVASDLSNKEIAGVLGIAERTLHERLQSIRRKMNVSGNSALIHHAMRLGLID